MLLHTQGAMVADLYHVLVVEDEPDPTVYLRLVLLRTGVPPGSDQISKPQQPVD